jgi:hypothetical protein
MSRTVAEAQAKAGTKFAKELLQEGGGTKPNRNKEMSEAGTTTKIIYPSTQTELQAAENLIHEHIWKNELTEIARVYSGYFINDFLLTVNKMLTEAFGTLLESPIDYEGNRAGNEWIQLEVDVNEKGDFVTESAFYGSIKVPTYSNAVLTIYPGGKIGVRVINRFKGQIETLLESIAETLRGKKVMEGKPLMIEATRIGLKAIPFQPKEAVNIVLSDKVNRAINTIVKPQIAKSLKKSFKVLMSGPYGTGKTETAIHLGMLAARSGRTYFHLNTSGMLKQLFPYLANYQGFLAFAEDVDQITSGERDESMDEILNYLDGPEAKKLNGVFVFTTNSPEKIDPAMRRPGRLDLVLTLDYCTVEQIEEIFSLNFVEYGIEPGTIDYKKLAEMCPDKFSGSEVTQVCKRAYEMAASLEMPISFEIIEVAIESMVEQHNYLHEPKVDPTMDEMLGKVLKDALQKSMPALVSEYGN